MSDDSLLPRANIAKLALKIDFETAQPFWLNAICPAA
jgi:hypothetical protein